MQCELCGAPIHGPSKTVQIEGAELCVCVRCAKYGTEVQQSRRGGAPVYRAGKPVASTPQPRRRPRDVFDLIEGEIVDDYSTRIRTAREMKGWSTQDLAHEIKEREVLIKKIEKGDLIPEDAVRKKIERALEIKLVDSSVDEAESRSSGRVTTTIGDVISFKKIRK
ncbi:TIGR00270 family protein [Methanoculleus sp. FWC-SCC1]|uniref:TIGR00270 family protein n=1 Tax=Methanoculleus frigidifontis TaxID=2584085 RepID=A0ABT8M667_9EURY|nr:multiprotein bridging factor aMBF1 [Methanoculleus sp. FWC-SCC1]MDN7023430.1 TIGR00270 family protein [Methanoculleus sp. FWC-SCC1]